MKLSQVRIARLTATAVGLAVLTVTPTAIARAPSAPPAPRTVTDSVGDLPADGPAALYSTQPPLPPATGWPASNSAFPATSGTGRLWDGAFYWTDWLYDDHGATTVSVGDPAVTAGAPSFGTYTYPAGPAANSGADIFRAAVAVGRNDSYWRVDWTTLVSARVPIAEWTFDRGEKETASDWPAGAGISSPGIDTALVVSAQGAELIDAVSGRLEHRLPVTVSLAAHSFVVAVPLAWLSASGIWRIRLASGLANPSGTGFARPPDALPSQPAVYNVTFRTTAQEQPSDNFWNDEAQTKALDKGDVSAFSARLDWSRLDRRVDTPEARPTGWSDRWYVSSANLGNGVLVGANDAGNGGVNYLGQVQPYAVYVPTGYTGRSPTPLTFLLHSLSQNMNQYAATTPTFTQQACQDRRSICVTTLGRGPDGNYWDYAELDFWQVWHAVAAAYDLDPNRTILCGYSMGGIGTNQLAIEHPDLFAEAVTLAGAVGDVSSLVNLRWIPTYLAGGAEDELVLVTEERAEANRLAALGFRYRWLVEPAMDHVGYELADSFSDAAAYMRGAVRTVDPPTFVFTWDPANEEQSLASRVSNGGGLSWTQLPAYGIGTTGDYWVRALRARSAGTYATVEANSGELNAPSVTIRSSAGIDPGITPEPGLISTLTWTLGAAPCLHPVVTLKLLNVQSLTLFLGEAGFTQREAGMLQVSSDGPVTIRLGKRVLQLPAGTSTTSFQA